MALNQHDAIDEVVYQYTEDLLTPNELFAAMVVIRTTNPRCDCLQCIE